MAIYYGTHKIGELIIGARDATSTPISLATPTITINSTTGVITATVQQLTSGYLNAGTTTATYNALVSHPDPTIQFNGTTGVIVARHTQTAGYVAGGTVTATTSIPVADGSSVTPSSVTQTVSTLNKYMLGNVVINPIPSEYIIPSGNLNIQSQHNNTTVNVAPYSTVTVSIPTGSSINNQNKTVSPTSTQQTITADVDAHNYTGLGTVTVNSIPGTYVGGDITRRNSLSVSGLTITANAGYYAAAVATTIPSTTHSAPVVSFNSSTGLFTATHSTAAGYVAADTKSDTIQLTVVAGQTITPNSTVQQPVPPGGRYVSGAITVNSVNATSLSVTSNGTYTPTAGSYYSSVNVNVAGGGGSVTPMSLQTKTVTYTPAESQIVATISPDTGYDGLSSVNVTVNSIPSTYVGSAIPRKTSADLVFNSSNNLFDPNSTVINAYTAAATGKLTSSSPDRALIIPLAVNTEYTFTWNKTAINNDTTDDVGIALFTSYPTINMIGRYIGQSKVNGGTLTFTTSASEHYAVIKIANINKTEFAPTRDNSTLYATNGNVISAPSGYYQNGAFTTIPTETLTITSNGTYTPSTNKLFSSVTVDVPTGSGGTAVFITEENDPAGGKIMYITGVDLSQDTVDAAHLVSGYTAHDRTGAAIVGTYAGAIINNQAKTATPTTSQQIITPDSNYTGLSQVTVNAIPSQFKNTSDATATAASLLSGATAYNSSGKITGTMANNGALASTITTQNGTYTIPAGYTSGGTIKATLTATTLTNSIISGVAYEEATGDYAWKTTVNIPAGYHNAQSLEKTFSSIFPAPDTPATASQILLGYQAYDKDGKLVTGTMANNSYSNTLDDTRTSITIPAGYHDGTGTVSHTTVNIPDPTISVSAAGLITASGSWTKGFTTDSSYSKTLQLSTVSATTVTPSSVEQTLAAAGKYTTGTLKVNPIPSQYVIPSGNLAITVNTTGVDVTNYATVSVSVAAPEVTHQAKIHITPLTTSQTIIPDTGYEYLDSVQIDAMPTLTLPTSPTTTYSGTSIGSAIGRSTSTRYLSIPVGYNTTARYYTISAVANGSATTPTTSITASFGTGSVSSTGLVTIPISNTSKSITPTVVEGYVSSGTAGTITVTGSGTYQLTTLGATTYNVSSSNQTITSGKYITGTQTIRGVTTSGISAGNIKVGTTITVGDSANASRITSVTGTFTSDATATAAQINSGATAYVNGSKITGTQTFSTIHTGSSAPSNSVGANGDVYLVLA